MLDRKLWHKSITPEVVAEAVEAGNTGFCLICGDEADGVEPDAENHTCESCGAEQVFGAETILIVIA